jgi:hypothetical protein
MAKLREMDDMEGIPTVLFLAWFANGFLALFANEIVRNQVESAARTGSKVQEGPNFG